MGQCYGSERSLPQRRKGIDTCSVCGGDLLGDGSTSVVHCENAEVGDGYVVECNEDKGG